MLNNNYVEWKKGDTRILRGDRGEGKNEIPPTPTVRRSKEEKQAVRGKIADVLRQCYTRL